MNLREQAEADLAITLEDDSNGFGLPIELLSPAGARQTVNGQVLYDTSDIDQETGLPITVHNPVAVVRISSLTTVPANTDSPKWACRIPVSPSRTATKVTFSVERVSEDGQSIGFLRLYLTRVAQS